MELLKRCASIEHNEKNLLCICLSICNTCNIDIDNLGHRHRHDRRRNRTEKVINTANRYKVTDGTETNLTLVMVSEVIFDPAALKHIIFF